MWQKIVDWFKNLFNHQTVHHEGNGMWWQKSGNLVKVGLITQVIDELGEVTFLGTPQLDEKINKADQLINIEGGKAVETFKSPVTGTISKVNDEYQEQPEKLLNAKNPLLVEIKTA